jgi:N-acetylmuramoyl-L-alanine amidase
MVNTDWYKALLALTVWREARGEPIEGKLGVANVVKNRVNATHLPDQWDTVMERRWAFSSLTAPGDAMLVQWPVHTDPSWIDSMNAADRVFTLGGADNTQGATLYANLDVCTPEWLPNVTPTVKLGKHSFFIDRKPA